MLCVCLDEHLPEIGYGSILKYAYSVFILTELNNIIVLFYYFKHFIHFNTIGIRNC